jgi:HEAT repeat protein
MGPTITDPGLQPPPGKPEKKEPSGPDAPVLQPAPKDPPLPPAPGKEPDKKDPMGSAPTWPTEIGGRDAKAYVKDLFDPDPAIREIALKTLPNFGPAVREATTPDGKTPIGKALLARMDPALERDPGVRLAAYTAASLIGFKDEKDVKEATRLLAVTVDAGPPGSQVRLQAIQTLGTLGPKAEFVVEKVATERVASSEFEPSYEIRRSLAATLAQIGLDEKTGPNVKALHCLTTFLIKDRSAVVRLEAMQALVALGPPVHKIPVLDPKDPAKKIDQPVTDKALAEPYAKAIKARLAPVKKTDPPTPTGLVESSAQVEIWTRVALMRFDSTEINPENLDGISKYVSGSDYGAKIQALAALGILGEIGARRLDKVVEALSSEDPSVVYAALTALVMMGPAAKPAIPEIEKLKTRGKDEKENKEWRALAEAAIQAIKDPPKQQPAPAMDKKP